MAALVLVSVGAPAAVFLRFLPMMLWPIRQIADTAEDSQPVPAPEVVLD